MYCIVYLPLSEPKCSFEMEQRSPDPGKQGDEVVGIVTEVRNTNGILVFTDDLEVVSTDERCVTLPFSFPFYRTED